MRTTCFLFFIFLNCCTPALKIYYGYHDPKPEDKESLNKYLHKKNINADNILVYADSVNYKKLFYEIKSVPEMRVFDKAGVLIYYRDTSGECSGPGYEFTEVICSSKNLKSNPAITLDLNAKNLLTLDNNPVEVSIYNDYDYYVFIYWARFLGRLNKVKTKVWEENLKNVKDCKVMVYKVNMDWQKRWDEKK